MKEYHELLTHVLTHAEEHEDRTGVGTYSVFGYQMRHDMSRGFPLLTTKKLSLRWIFEELRWFLSGSTDEHDLRNAGVDIWKEWATAEQCAKFKRPEGELGPVYGSLMRSYPVGTARTNAGPEIARSMYFDQIATLMREIKETPNSRRLIVTHWHPYWSRKVTLPACHTMWQTKCHGETGMSLHLYARSIDSFLGLPYNLASYGLLLELLCAACGRRPLWLVISFGDLHIYKNHVEQVREQLSREPRSLPRLTVKGSKNPWEYTWADIELEGYDPYPSIKAEVAV